MTEILLKQYVKPSKTKLLFLHRNTFY